MRQIVEIFNKLFMMKSRVLSFIIAILCAMPLFKNILNIENKTGKAVVNIWLLLLFFLSVSSIAASTYNPFIYFRF